MDKALLSILLYFLASIAALPWVIQKDLSDKSEKRSMVNMRETTIVRLTRHALQNNSKEVGQ